MVRMQDIAAEVGVSQTTVSLVLNKKHTDVRISEKTRRCIEETAARRGYHRNEIARAMVTGKTNVVGFLAYETKAEYIGQILSGAIKEAEKHNYFLKIFSVSSREHFETILKKCFEQRLAGIVCRSLTEDMLTVLRDKVMPYKIPIALVDSSFSHSWGIRVVSNDERGALLVVKHLVDLGHKRIAHLSTSPDSGYAVARRRGYQKAMTNFGLKVPDDFLAFGESKWDERESAAVIAELKSLTLKLLNKKPGARPTAIFCGSDPVAMVVLRTLREKGFKVPADISVVGFANMLMSKLSDPPLTTVNQPFIQMGISVMKRLIKEIESADLKSFSEQVEEIVDVNLVIRKSTGKPGK